MATISSEQDQSAEIVIPAAYLEDVRTALIAEIKSDGEILDTNHQDVLDGRGYVTEDRTSSVDHLRRAMGMLDQVLDAEDETTVTGASSTIGLVLEGVARVLAARLVEQAQYGPMPMHSVLELASRVHWVASEAIRVAPWDFDDPTEA